MLDSVFLPGVHPHVADGGRHASAGPQPVDALGIIETRTVAAAIAAADAGIKGAEVNLVEVRLADGLGGKGLVFFSGLVHDVEAAVRIAVECISVSPHARPRGRHPPASPRHGGQPALRHPLARRMPSSAGN